MVEGFDAALKHMTAALPSTHTKTIVWNLAMRERKSPLVALIRPGAQKRPQTLFAAAHASLIRTAHARKQTTHLILHKVRLQKAFTQHPQVDGPIVRRE